MLANYHTHTPRCNHAEGSERDYAEAALAAGLRVLGFSDHTPQYFPGDYYSFFRMRPERLDDYVDAVLAVRAAYRGRLDVPLGLEAEYYPALFPRLLKELRARPFDYLILGQHALGNEEGDAYSGTPTSDPATLRRYVDQVCEAMQTGLFSCFAHPDIMPFTGDEAVWQAEMRRLCETALACKVPLEINLLGLAGGRCYPNEAFWRIAGTVGNTAVLGCDAHHPEQLRVPELENRARAMAARCGVHVQETLQLKPIR